MLRPRPSVIHRVHARAVVAAAIAALVSACGDVRDPRVDSVAAGAPPPGTVVGDAVVAVDSIAPRDIRLVRRRARDLTGDGRPEQFTVSARGPAFDTLDVRLEIRSDDGQLLHLARWSSYRYFHYDYRDGKADSTVERIVRAHVDRLLADSAFIAVRTGIGENRVIPPDPEIIRYDLAELRLRSRRATPDTAPSPMVLVTGYWRADGAGDTTRASRPLVDSLVRELTDRPSFRYFAGGEETYTLAWSDRLRRFVRIFACC